MLGACSSDCLFSWEALFLTLLLFSVVGVGVGVAEF
jgi:hypothetical protein